MQYILCFAESISSVEYAWVVAGHCTDIPRIAVVRTSVGASAVRPSSVRPSSVRPTSVVEELENMWTYELVVMSVIYFELVNLRTWNLKNLWTCSDSCDAFELYYDIFMMSVICVINYEYYMWYLFVRTLLYVKNKKKRFSVWSLCHVP